MTLDKKRLTKLLLVMMSSDQSGEVMAARDAIAKLLKNAKLDMHWLADALTTASALPLSSPPKAAPSTQTHWSAHWIDQLLYCVQHLERVQRQNQREFLFSLAEQMDHSSKSWQPSARQRDWLNNIYDNLKTWEKVYGTG